MTFSETCNKIFADTVALYHESDDVDATVSNPYHEGTVEHTLFAKNWIDAVQWHLEDIIRLPDIDPVEALALKRRIDRSNQERTDMVEELDTYFLQRFSGVDRLPAATINTESPAWAVDRLSILALKIYHWDIEARRTDATEEHRQRAASKLAVMLEQRTDLSAAIDTLLDDMAAGRKLMKAYRQMKMYNDPSTNPMLYGKKA